MARPFARTTRALASDSPRGAMVALALAGVVILVWLSWFLLAPVTLYENSRSARLEVGTAPRAIAPTEGGRVIASALAIGRRVRAGDVLLALDDGVLRARLAGAERRLRDFPLRLASIDRELGAIGTVDRADSDAARAATRAAQARAAEAATAAQFAEATTRRVAADSAAGGVARAEADRAAADARRASQVRDALAEEARRLDADARVRSGQGRARLEELARTRLALHDEQQATEAQVAQLRTAIDARAVRAPIDGTIAEVPSLPPGSVVGAGQRVATIVPTGDLFIVARFDPATALGRIHPGQHATLRLAGYPWAEFGIVGARVSRVASELGDGTLRVELRATRNALRGVTLAHGLSGNVEVAVERVTPARLLLRALGGMLR